MSDAPEREPEPPVPERGVFGNLPDARPGPRSPRRDAARAGRKPDPERPSAKPKRAAPRERPAPKQPERPAAERPAEPAAEPAAEEQGGGLEDIAWAGVAAAAEAATIGVRLASRAIEALRGNAEKE